MKPGDLCDETCTVDCGHCKGTPFNVPRRVRISDGSPRSETDQLGPVIRETGEIFGVAIVLFVCSCGVSTDWHVLELEDEGRAEMRRHLAGEHSDAVGFGLCAECGQVTDWLRAHSELAGDAWLCPAHAPATSLRTILGSQEASVTL